MNDTRALVIKLLHLVSASDNDVSPQEIALINSVQNKYNVSQLDVDALRLHTLDEVLELLPREDLREHIGVLIKLLKADGVIQPEELKIFNAIDKNIFEK